jgi:RNA polymerase sigma factor for flagellar operon FliA
MQAVARGARLTPGDAEALWRAWTTRQDQRARDELVLSYAPMVRYLASRKVRELPPHCDVDDLVSCGLLALLQSVDRFDPALGATFEQYAWSRVTGAIIDELRRQDWASRSVRHLARKIEGARDRLYARTGLAPGDDEIAAELGVPVSQLQACAVDTAQADVMSLNAPARVGDDAVGIEVGDTVESGSKGSDPVRMTLAEERRAAIRSAVSKLGDREREVLRLVHVQELSGHEIAVRFGVTESRVSQLLGSARRKLQKHVADYDAGRDAA